MRSSATARMVVAALFAGTSLSGAAAQDQTFDLTVTDADRPYGTPGYTFRVIPITVTDPASFRVDAVNTVGTIAPVGVVDFIIFGDGVLIPDGPGTSFGSHAFDPNSVGYFFDGSPNGQNPTPVTSGPAGPLTAGDFQLVVAPYDSSGTGGDYAITLELTGVTSSIAPVTTSGLATLAGATGSLTRLAVVDIRRTARLRGQDSLATRDEVLSFTRVADPDTGGVAVTQSTMDSVQMMGNVYTWIDFTGFRAEDDAGGRDYSGRGLQIGADMAIGTDMVAGLSFGVQDLDASVGAVSQDGVLRYIQPYFAYRSGNWAGEASLIWGWGDYTQTSGGGTGEGETRLAALTFDGGYDFALGNGLTATPTIGLAHGRERIEGVGGTLAGAGTETVRFTQVSLGGEVRQTMARGEVFAGLHADWLDTDAATALVSDLLVDDGLTGRLELGLSTEIGGGLMLDTSVQLSGLGGDLQSTGGSLRFAFRF
jgi:hypothetical protein